jgi:hypothetical protein
MKDQEKRLQKENKQGGELVAEEVRRLAEEQERKTVYLAKEKEIERVSKVKHMERMEKRAIEETAQSAKDKERMKTLFAREKDIADAEIARKLDKQQSR